MSCPPAPGSARYRPTLDDLATLDGEILPERTVMGTVSNPFGVAAHDPGAHDSGAGGSGADGSGPTHGATSASGSGSSAAAGPSAGHGTAVANSCQTTTSYGTPGLMGSLGLGSENPHTTTTCTPGTVATR